jgi:hypothetical protein
MRTFLEKFYAADTVVAAFPSTPETDQISKHSFGKKAPSVFVRKSPRGSVAEVQTKSAEPVSPVIAKSA